MPKILDAWRIYTLTDPRTSKIRYVGVTSRTITRRLKAHISESRVKLPDGSWEHKYYAANWIRQLDGLGLKPIVTLVEEGSGPEWGEREKYWIKYYRDAGCPLTNTAEGGQGNFGWKPTDQMRQASAERAFAQWKNDSHRALIAEASSRNWEVQRQFMIEKIKASLARPEVKLKHSLAKRGTNHHGARLTDEIVLQLRADFKLHRERIEAGNESPRGSNEQFYKHFADKLDVSPKQVAKIISGRAWKHLLPKSPVPNQSKLAS